MYYDLVQLCAQLVPTFKFDKVGKEIPKSIIKERLENTKHRFSDLTWQYTTLSNLHHKKCKPKKMLVKHNSQVYAFSYATLNSTGANQYQHTVQLKKENVQKKVPHQLLHRLGHPIRGLALSFCSGSLCSTGCTSILHLQKTMMPHVKKSMKKIACYSKIAATLKYDISVLYRAIACYQRDVVH